MIKNGFTDKQFAATLPNAVIVLDLAYRIIWWNHAAEKLLGLKPENQTKYLTSVLTQKHLKDHLASPDYFGKTLEISSPENPEIHLAIQIFPYKKTQYLLIAEDITHTYHLEKMRQDFVANVSHELRTPLTVFRGYLEILLENVNQKTNKAWKDILLQMLSQSTRMERIIEDLLLLSRLEIDTSDSEPAEAIDMRTLLHAIYQDALALSGDKQQHIHLEIAEPIIFYANKSELQSAFSNLVFNAVHYTPKHGTIHINWYRDKKGIHFKVTDTGIGIEVQHIPRLTERFYRVDAGRNRETGGTGLGLAIVKHVLLRHHGRLSISSTVNKGSVFRCDFPDYRATNEKQIGD